MLAALALLVAGCGSEEEDDHSEGREVKIGNSVWEVQYTRILNAEDPEDGTYLEDQPAITGDEMYLGVFVLIENKGDKPYTPPSNVKLVESAGEEFSPVTSDSPFALNFSEAIPPGGQAPTVDTVAHAGSTDGSMILFRASQETIQKQPVKLEIPSGKKKEEITLDL